MRPRQRDAHGRRDQQERSGNEHEDDDAEHVPVGPWTATASTASRSLYLLSRGVLDGL